MTQSFPKSYRHSSRKEVEPLPLFSRGTLLVSNVKDSYIFVLGGIIPLSLKMGTEGYLGKTTINKVQ